MPPVVLVLMFNVTLRRGCTLFYCNLRTVAQVKKFGEENFKSKISGRKLLNVKYKCNRHTVYLKKQNYSLNWKSSIDHLQDLLKPFTDGLNNLDKYQLMRGITAYLM